MSRLQEVGARFALVGATIVAPTVLLTSDGPQPQAELTGQVQIGDATIDTRSRSTGDDISDVVGSVMQANVDAMSGSMGFLHDYGALLLPFILAGSSALILHSNRDKERPGTLSSSTNRQIALAKKGLLDIPGAGSSESTAKNATTGTAREKLAAELHRIRLLFLGSVAMLPVANGLLAATMSTDGQLVDSLSHPYELLAAMSGFDEGERVFVLPEGQNQPYTEGTINGLGAIDDERVLPYEQLITDANIDGEATPIQFFGLPTNIFPGTFGNDEAYVDGHKGGEVTIAGRTFEITGQLPKDSSSLQRTLVTVESSGKDAFGAIVEAEDTDEAAAILEKNGIDPSSVVILNEQAFFDNIKAQGKESISAVMAQQLGYIAAFAALAYAGVTGIRMRSARRQMGLLRAVGATEGNLMNVAMIHALGEGLLSGARGLMIAVPLDIFTAEAQVGIQTPTLAELAKTSAASTALMTTIAILIARRQVKIQENESITSRVS